MAAAEGRAGSVSRVLACASAAGAKRAAEESAAPVFAAAAPAGRPAHSAQAEHARVSQAQRSAHEVGAPSVVCVAHHSKQRAANEKDG